MGEKFMLLWALAIFVAAFSLLRFKPLRKNIGTLKATVVLALRLITVAITLLLASPIAFTYHQTAVHPARIAILVDASLSTNSPSRRQVIRELKRALQPISDSVLAWEFSNELKPVTLDNLSEIAEGRDTNLLSAINKVIRSVQPDELLIITDAQNTEAQPNPEEVLETLRQAKTRLNALLLTANLPPNLKVSISPMQAFLFAGESANFTVKVEGERIKGSTTVELRVWDLRKLVFQTRLKLVGNATQVSIPLNPDKSGWHRYRFKVSPISGEVWTKDNSAESLVWQAPTKLRVLLITGPPTFEFKFVKQAIESEPNFEWVATASLPDGTRYQQGSPSLLPASLQRLEPFHVLVVLAPTPDDFGSTEGKIAWQFVQNGGGLLVTFSEQTVRRSGWLIFVPEPLTVSPLRSPSKLSSVRYDLLGERLTNLPEIDAVWSVRPQLKPYNEALKVGDEPVLIWQQEGLGKVALFGADGTWKWVTEAARKGEEPTVHHKFWQTLVRFLADPTKGTKHEPEKEISMEAPEHPPAELVTPPDPERLKAWVKATGGQILGPNDLVSWVKGLKLTKEVNVPSKRRFSEIPLPYILLVIALSIEWWLVRRSGLP